MKKKFFALSLAVAATFAAQAQDVGVSVHVSQPGVYGRIDIGRFPQPQLVMAQPIVVQPAVVVQQQPVYMYVPYEHRKKWSKNCYRYNACGTPVYFVQHGWYQQQVRGHDHGHYRDDDHDDDDRGRRGKHDKRKHKHKHDD